MVRIVFAGDIMLARGVGEKLLVDYKDLISSDIKQILKNADLCVGNLECPITVNGKKQKETSFKASPDSLTQVDDFSLLSLANNHVYDCGLNGVKETIDTLNNGEVKWCGIVENPTKHIEPVVFNINGKTLAFYGCVVDECSKGEKDWFPKVIEISRSELWDAIKLNSNKFDKTIILLHGGNEMIPYPQPSFKSTCQKFIDSGADFVITSHPHVVGGYEKYKEGFIFYSLGDFIFDADSFIRKRGLLLSVNLYDDNFDFEFIPTLIDANYRVTLAHKKVKKGIINKIRKVSTEISNPNYSKKYSLFFYQSLLKFQIDRLVYLLRRKGFIYFLKFIFKKVNLISHYFRVVARKEYK